MHSLSKRSFLIVFAAAALAVLPAFAAAATDAEMARSSNEKASRDLIKRLFAACPGAKKMLRASEGFATFTGVGDGHGSGVARPTRTRTPAYMQFDSSGAAGKRDLVFVFSSRDDFSRFVVTGGTLGGEAAGGEAGDCSQSLSPGVRVFQIEGNSLVGGTVPTATYSKASLN
jgi:hypothetical protein